MRRMCKLGVAAVLFAGGALSGTPAHAFLLIEGAPTAVHLVVRDVPLRQVLDAMQAKFNLRYRTDDDLDRSVTGTFDGPLRRVAVRVLDGYDFAMKVTSDGIDVLVLRQNRAGPVLSALLRTRPARSRPMTAQEANRRERGLQ